MLRYTMTIAPMPPDELKQLYKELAVPLAVHLILCGEKKADAESLNNLDIAVAELPLDAALLSISMSGAHIAQALSETAYHKISARLGPTAASIVHAHGAAWLHRLRTNSPAPNPKALESDFRALAGQIGACADALRERTVLGVLCDIFAHHAEGCAEQIAQNATESVPEACVIQFPQRKPHMP